MSLFPACTPEYLLSFQFSSWYPTFAHISIPSTVIRPLSDDFREYLDADGVVVPLGSDDAPVASTLSDSEDEDDADADADDDDDDGDQPRRRFAFPDLDAQIRAAIQTYGAVFPKLNFSAPKDAAWILTASAPLKCTSPADVYLLLKSSDFAAHDLAPDTVFAGCLPPPSSPLPQQYTLELVLRKWYPIDPSREMRCFVRQDTLLGISQRDTNYYDFLNDVDTQTTIVSAVTRFWETHIKRKTANEDYAFDILLTRDLSRAHLIDFNPYAPRTDPLLFTYDSLLSLLGDRSRLPLLRVVDSRTHPAANRNAPTHQHNMVPFEALSMSSGTDIEEFAALWQQEIRKTFDD